MLLCHVLDLTVVHEHDIAKLVSSNPREAGSWRSWLGLLACLALFHHSVVQTVNTLWQVQLTGSSSELCCAHVIVLQMKLEQLCPLGEPLMQLHQRWRYQTIQIQFSLWQNFSFFFSRKRWKRSAFGRYWRDKRRYRSWWLGSLLLGPFTSGLFLSAAL